MKRTIIKYQNVGKDKIKVVGIENCASIDEIEEKFGYNVKEEYDQAYDYNYERIFNGVSVYTPIEGGDGAGFCDLMINETYPKEYFTNAIKWMRLAGERLGRIVKKEREKEAGKIKEIVI